MGLKGCVLTLRSKRLENLVTIDMVYDNKETWMPLDLYFLGVFILSKENFGSTCLQGDPFALGIQSASMGMEPKDYAEEGIGHPNQHLRIWLDSYRVEYSLGVIVRVWPPPTMPLTNRMTWNFFRRGTPKSTFTFHDCIGGRKTRMQVIAKYISICLRW